MAGKCVPRYEFQLCSNCEVQHSYLPTTTANHVFNVLPCRGAALSGTNSICTGVANAPRVPALQFPPRCSNTHFACVYPTAPHRPALCIPAEDGARPMYDRTGRQAVALKWHQRSVIPDPRSKPAKPV